MNTNTLFFVIPGMAPSSRLPQWVLGFLAIALVCMSCLSPRTSWAQDDKVKVVYHADFADPRRFSAMLTSINNMATHYTNELVDFDIRIVFVAHGIRFLTDDALKETPFAQDAELAEQRENLRGRLNALNTVHQVKIEVCDITRSQINLAPERLYSYVQSVPSGVVRLAELQTRQGFAYLKIE
jgi:intracellular sulfur oxidation DsrE/DsrF family protein